MLCGLILSQSLFQYEMGVCANKVLILLSLVVVCSCHCDYIHLYRILNIDNVENSAIHSSHNI